MNKIYSDIEKTLNEYYEKSVYFKYKKITENKDGSVSFSINNIKLYGVKVANQGLYFFIKNQLFDMLTDIPVTYSFADLPSLPEFRRIIIAENDFITLLVYITNNLDNYAREFILPTDYFDCCSRFEECSNTMKCINPYPDLAARCTYRRKLENGIVFYGENCNVNNHINFTAIDFETANPKMTSACSIGITVVKNGEIVKKEEYYIKPYPFYFAEMNVSIHGITEEMVSDAPDFGKLWKEISHLFENTVVVAHNASFDISVLRHLFEYYLITPPDFQILCTYRLAQVVYPSSPCYKLNVLCEQMGIELEHHDAGDDSKACADILLRIFKDYHIKDFSDFEEKYNISLGSLVKYNYTPCRCSHSHSKKPSCGNSYHRAKEYNEIKSDYHDDDFCGKNFVFTGTLRSMTRDRAMKIVALGGGHLQDSITKCTDYLVIGYESLMQKSTKYRKAEEYKSNGINIEVICEDQFIQMIDPEIFEMINSNISNAEPQNESGSLNNYEKYIIDFIKKAIGEEIRIEERSSNYLSLVTSNNVDFCRVKATARVLWFSLDIWAVDKELRNDELLSNVQNKNQRHWKIYLDNMQDIIKYEKIIKASYIGSKRSYNE